MIRKKALVKYKMMVVDFGKKFNSKYTKGTEVSE